MTYSRSVTESAPVLAKIFQEIEAVFGRSTLASLGVRYLPNGVLISTGDRPKLIDLVIRHFREAGWGYGRQETAVRADRPDTLTKIRHVLTSEERFSLMAKPKPDAALQSLKPVSLEEASRLVDEFNRNFPELREMQQQEDPE